MLVSTIEIVFSPILATHACRLSLVSVTTWARSPVAMDATVSSVRVLIADSRPEARLVAKSQRPSRETARSWVAWLRESTVAMTWKESPSTTVTEFELSLATKTRDRGASSVSFTCMSAQPATRPSERAIVIARMGSS